MIEEFQEIENILQAEMKEEILQKEKLPQEIAIEVDTLHMADKDLQEAEVEEGVINHCPDLKKHLQSTADTIIHAGNMTSGNSSEKPK